MKYPSSITDTATIDGHFYSLFFDTRLVCSVAILQHESFSFANWILATIALCTMGISSRFHNFVAATIRAGYFLIIFHADNVS